METWVSTDPLASYANMQAFWKFLPDLRSSLTRGCADQLTVLVGAGGQSGPEVLARLSTQAS